MGEYTTYQIPVASELRPEVTLVPKVGGENPVVSLLESDDFKSANVVDVVKFTCGVSSERSTSNPGFVHLLNDVCGVY